VKMIVGLLGFGLLIGATVQLKNALKASFAPDAAFSGGPDESDETPLPSGDISRIVAWSLVFSTAMFVLAQVLTP
jgi:hypothetical protein